MDLTVNPIIMFQFPGGATRHLGNISIFDPGLHENKVL